MLVESGEEMTKLALASALLCIAAAASADGLSSAAATAARVSSGALASPSVLPSANVPPPTVCSAGELAPARLSGSEMLRYKLDVYGADIGTFEMQLGRAAPADRARAPLVIEARGKSSDLVSSNVRKVDGWSSSLVDDEGRVVRYREEVDEGGTHRSQEVALPAADGVLDVRATKDGEPEKLSLPATPAARDLLSGLFVLRQQPLTPGQQLCAEIYAARRMWRVEGTVAAKPESIDTPLGKLDTLRIDAVATRLDDPKVVRKAHVWITRDDRRLPAVILGEIRGRYIRATLLDAKQNRRAMTRR
jgi:hypothetical protein